MRPLQWRVMSAFAASAKLQTEKYGSTVTSGYTVVGRAEHTVTSGGTLTVRRGAFLYDNYTSAAVSASDIGKAVYVHDDSSVQAFDATSGAVNIIAGKLLGFAEGQAIVEIR